MIWEQAKESQNLQSIEENSNQILENRKPENHRLNFQTDRRRLSEL